MFSLPAIIKSTNTEKEDINRAIPKNTKAIFSFIINSPALATVESTIKNNKIINSALIFFIMYCRKLPSAKRDAVEKFGNINNLNNHIIVI